MAQIYLDFNASTPIAPEVQAAMLPLLVDGFGNPSCGHAAGQLAREALARARAQVAKLIGATSEEIVFTSGGSEANNLALKGSHFALRHRGDHIITQATEHPAVLRPLAFLEQLGARVTRLPVDAQGRVDPDSVRHAIAPRTVLISIMHANNETGTLQPIDAIGSIAREHGIRLHTDAAQSVGKIVTRVDEMGVDLLSIAGHKLYAPKGVGALYVRNGVLLEPLIHGAGHEGGRRAGTESALMAVALGAACDLAARSLADAAQRQRDLVDHFWLSLKARFGERVTLNGHSEHRLPNTLNVNFVGRSAAQILATLPDVAASAGSACHSGTDQLSSVLAAMGVPQEVGRGAIRFSLGRETTRDEIDTVLGRLTAALA